MPNLLHPDARQLSPDAQKEKRATALRMRDQGHTYQRIAEALGVNRRTVQHWVSVRAALGDEAVIEGGQRGAEFGQGRRLTPEQEIQTQRWVADRMPDQLKLPFALWTRGAIRELIQAQFGIQLPVRTVGLYLQRWNYTAQRPWQRALERRPAEVKHWLEHDYPALAQRAKTEGATILWGDETGVRNEPYVGKSYAPRGRTPEVAKSVKRFGLNMISAVSNKGELRFMLYDDTLNAARFLAFLKRLVKGEERKLFLILDNLRVHHSEPVKRWCTAHADQIELFFLPSYSPELNPDEYINGQLKAELRAKPATGTLAALSQAVFSTMRRLQRMPQRIRSLFNHPSIVYAACVE